MSATKPPGHAGVEQHNNADGSQPGDVRSNAGSTEDGLVIGGAVVLMTTNSWYYRDPLRLFAVTSGLLRVRWGQVMYAGVGLVRVGRVSLAAVR